jgi:hypothetical protein
MGAGVAVGRKSARGASVRIVVTGCMVVWAGLYWTWRYRAGHEEVRREDIDALEVFFSALYPLEGKRNRS